jgi:multiple sugar transport system substrate-binding protein
MSRKIKVFALLLLVAILMVALSPNPSPNARVAKAQEKVTVTWFVGLGAGAQPQDIDPENAFVEEFNATVGEEKGIELVIVIANNDVAYDTLSTLLASPEPPDIVGPVGIRGSNSFDGNWADLEPLAEAAGYDLSQFAQAQVDFYRVEGQGLVGLPFGAYASAVYFNRDLFDAAGLPYPPQAYGEPYADGDPWDFNKVEELALQLTLDANGNNATSPDFDPENIVQFGFHEQFSNFTRMASEFGAGTFVGPDGTAVMPEQWAEFTRWYYSGIWEKHFIPSASYVGSDLLAAGNPFNSGHVAMAHTHLWYTCCLADVPNWDLAVVPEYNGVVTAPLHVDTFRILKQSRNPEAAFEVLSYMLGDGSLPLLQIYGSMPARAENQQAFFDGLNERFPHGVNWQVVIDGVNFPDSPSHEANMPNFQKADERVGAFQTLIESTPDLDVDAEMDTLVADLQAIFDEVQ